MNRGWRLLVLIMILSAVAASLFFYFFHIPTETENPTRRVLEVIKLPDPDLKGQMSVEEAIQNRSSVREYSNKSLSLKDISQLLCAA